MPDVVSAGTIEAHAHLLGSISAPTGAVDLEAHGFRFTSDEAVGLPPLDLDAKAQLAGDDASVDVRLRANGASLLTATGGVPLNPAGAYDLEDSREDGRGRGQRAVRSSRHACRAASWPWTRRWAAA